MSDEELEDIVDARWSQLYHLEKDAAEGIFKYLFFVNSGGAVATLSFMGTSKFALNSMQTQLALLLFMLGVIFIGTTQVHRFHHLSSLFDNYKSDYRKYLAKEISATSFLEADEERARDSILHYVFSYGSFICFIAGSISGLLALLCGQT